MHNYNKTKKFKIFCVTDWSFSLIRKPKQVNNFSSINRKHIYCRYFFEKANCSIVLFYKSPFSMNSIPKNTGLVVQKTSSDIRIHSHIDLIKHFTKLFVNVSPCKNKYIHVSR